MQEVCIFICHLSNLTLTLSVICVNDGSELTQITDKQNRLLYAAVKAYKVGVDIPVTDVDAELPLLEMVAVDNGKLEDVYGVYSNGCIGINRRENYCGDKMSLEKV